MVGLTLKAEGGVISNFSLTHFNAAVLFANKVEETESANAGQPFGNFFEEISIYCSSCIIAAAASIEALINELYLTPGPLHNSIESFDEYFWGVENENNGLERKPALQKYKKAMNLLNKPPLKRDEEIYQHAEALIGFRNYLIHFKPLWDEDRRNKTLEDSLRDLFETCPFVDPGADYLAMHCMSAGAAKWSVETARNFILDFGKRAEILPKKFESFKV